LVKRIRLKVLSEDKRKKIGESELFRKGEKEVAMQQLKKWKR
jgi:hypothetical protein